MKKLFKGLLIALPILLTGCVASVPMADQAKSDELKQFKAPPQDKAALYIYRNNSIFGAALKRAIYVDGEKLGETAKGTFFYKQVSPGTHRVATESEFSNYHIDVSTVGGKNYFIRQYIKMGAFVGGANVEEVNEIQAKEDMADANLAQ